MQRIIYGDFLQWSESILRKILSPRKFLLFFIIFRLFNCLFVRTSFFPDEYAQSIEISHYWVFGYGHMPWEWEPCISLRSVVHPFIYAILFYILKITELDTPFFVLYVPKIFQGLCAAFGDYGFMKLIILWYIRLYREKEKKGKTNNQLVYTILACYFFCWFHIYSICRTSSNSFECIFNIWGIYYLSKNYYAPVPLNGNKSVLYPNDCSQNGDDQAVVTSSTGVFDFPLKGQAIGCLKRKNRTRGSGSGGCKSGSGSGGCKSGSGSGGCKSGSGSGGCKSGSGDNAYTYHLASKDVHDTQNNFKQVEYNKLVGLSKSKYFHIQNLLLSLSFSIFCIMMRPSAALFWVCIYISYFIKHLDGENILKWKEVLVIGCLYVFILLIIIIVIDSYYYGKITVSSYNFFVFNILSGENIYFGRHSFFFFFLCVIPSIYLLFTAFTFYGYVDIWKNMINKKKKKKNLFHLAFSRIDYVVYISTFVEVIFLSFSKHKEHKMVIGYLPFLSAHTGVTLHKVTCDAKNDEKEVYTGGKNEKNVEGEKNVQDEKNEKNVEGEKNVQDEKNEKNVEGEKNVQDEKNEKNVEGEKNEKNGQDAKNQRTKKFLFFLINFNFFLHLICTLFFCLIHNSSPEKVMAYFRNLKTNKDEDITIFITDCYDTPLYSHIHRKFKIGFLDCSPHIKKINGEFLYNWRKRIYDDNFGNLFYNMFNKKKDIHYINMREPYILPDESFYWFGHHHHYQKNLNQTKQFKFQYEKINYACLEYRFSNSLKGELPLYVVTNSLVLNSLNIFLKKFNYHLDTDPIFSYFVLEQGMTLAPVNHYIFKRTPQV
ncbi:GPI mannosyltransferase 3, putative [Plasmodium malariae]|uniref:Mannosyltransferase n=1 Tax=Plasmodium malariae TaxID=5858 RepID=A0A1C3L0N4_PLAMA|nr:GPI mannosyltransferase 3, putative [Plasmodium malariae]